jgi:hypothetical protein
MVTVRLRPADGVGVEVLGDAVYAAPLPDGPIMVLEGIAALIWREATAQPRESVADVVAATTGEDAASIRPSVDGFIDEMVSRGLLVPD